MHSASAIYIHTNANTSHSLGHSVCLNKSCHVGTKIQILCAYRSAYRSKLSTGLFCTGTELQLCSNIRPRGDILTSLPQAFQRYSAFGNTLHCSSFMKSSCQSSSKVARIPELAEHLKIPPLKCLKPSPCAQSEYELSESCRACHSHFGLIGKLFCHLINAITQAHH